MRRLPEHFDSTDPIEAYGAALLAKVARLSPSPSRKRRVWLALQARPVRRPLGRATGVVAAGLVLCGATGAGAAMSHLWMGWHRSAVVVATGAPAMPELPPEERPVSAEPIVAQVEAPPVAPKPTPAKPRPVDQAEPSARLMVEAMRARRAGNFARVRELAAEYRLKYPTAALNEEALALAIEAAAALGEGDAPRLAALYLQRYPLGRFRGQAMRALGSAR